MRVRKVCNNIEDTDVFFGSRVTRITEHHFQPATNVKQLLAAHSNDDALWDNTDPCDESLDNISGTESEYMRIHLSLIPHEIIDEYDIMKQVETDGYIYVEITGAMYG